VRQNLGLKLGVDYDKNRSPKLKPVHDPDVDDPEWIPLTYEINGSATAYAKIVPQLDVRVNSLAGFYANVDPRLEISGSASVNNGQVTSANLNVLAAADLNGGFSIVGFGSIDPFATFPLFSYEWSANYPPPAQITIRKNPQSQTVPVGGSVTFSVDASSAQPISYQWYNNGAEMIGKTDQNLTLNNVNLYHAGQYHIRLRSGGQTTNSDPATLTVVPASIQSGLLAWYPFNGNANDASGNGNNGVINGVTLTADRSGNPNSAFSFDGVNDYVAVPDSASLRSITNAITIAVWAKPSAWSGNWIPLLCKGQSGGFQVQYWMEFANHSGNWLNVLGNLYVVINNLPALGVWQHYALTYDRNFFIYYQNGVELGRAAYSQVLPSNTYQMEIGRDVPGSVEFFNGAMDDVRIYNRALSASEVQQLYNLSLPPAPSGMALIPGGSFTMGNCMNSSEGYSDELPLHTVYVSAFYMDKYEVTKALWDEVKGWNSGNGYSYENAGSGKATTHPVQTVNWRDCVKWCNARSQREGLTPCYYNEAGLTTVYKTGTGTPYPKWSANGHRLPTEAEWEKAARGGASGHRFPWSNVDTITHSQANYYSTNTYAYDTSPTRGYHPSFQTGNTPYTSPVGYFAANGYGLYDMAGNVWEWCWDWYSSTYYSSSPGTDPRGPASGSYGVLRGGSWLYNALGPSRCTHRGNHVLTFVSSTDGFRCVRGL
jgi:sulfatase modifying factor 1